MEKSTQSFDVCVVCALPEEARVFLEVVRQHCMGAIEKCSSPRYHYSYRFATIKNREDETLTLHVSWLPRYGPQEMILHLSHVLEECQPRIAIMAGICAGDAQRVQLGDLVVAERTFPCDNGKFTLDEQGRTIHQHDTLTYQLDANILQFLGLFDGWKPLVDSLERPPSPPEIKLERREVRCHIKAMASGSAVRADNPFEEVRAPVRGTVAIDMEGAAFGWVMSHYPLIRWLVVKSVCDYADRTKSDVYHDYAARVSALYVLSFIRSYVTNEQLPQQNTSSHSSQVGPLSGMGKTQTAAEVPTHLLPPDLRSQAPLALPDLPLVAPASEPDKKQLVQQGTALAEEQIKEGDRWYSQGCYDIALAAYERALTNNPESVTAFCGQGNAFWWLGNLPGALYAYRQALKLAPQPSLYCFIGHILMESGQYQDALEAYEQALRLQKDAETYTYQGIALSAVIFARQQQEMAGQDYDQVFEAYLRAKELDEAYTPAYYHSGRAFEAMKRYADALKEYQYAIDLGSRDAQVYYGVGRMRVKMDYLDEGLQAYNEALELNPGLGVVYVDKGDVLCQQKHFTEAEDAYKKALQLIPKNSKAHLSFGNFLRIQGDDRREKEKRQFFYQAALDEYLEATRLGRNTSYLWQQKAYVLRKLGKRDESDRAYREARRRPT